MAGAVWIRKAKASTTAAPQEEGEFKYVPGGRESFSLFLSHRAHFFVKAIRADC